MSGHALGEPPSWADDRIAEIRSGYYRARIELGLDEPYPETHTPALADPGRVDPDRMPPESEHAHGRDEP